jgi:hypothetical protein
LNKTLKRGRTSFTSQRLHSSTLLIFNAQAELIGRANLKDIDQRTASAYVGYRIAQH